MVKRLLLATLLVFWPSTPAVDYSGTGQYHTCDSGTDIDDMTSGMTVAFWATSDISSGDPRPAAKGNYAGVGWFLHFNYASTRCLGLWLEGSTDARRVAASGYCAAGLHHYAVTWAGSMAYTDIKIYYDGSEVSYGLEENGASYVSDAGVNLVIGAESDFSDPWDGKISCVAVWDKVLTAEEVSTIATGPCRAALRVQSANLRRLYEMLEGPNGGTGSTLHNLAGDQTCSVTGSPIDTALNVEF